MCRVITTILLYGGGEPSHVAHVWQINVYGSSHVAINVYGRSRVEINMHSNYYMVEGTPSHVAN